MAKATKELMIPDELVMNKIYMIRGQKVMLDRDLSELYGVETRTLNQAVKRNTNRFPEDFMFQLTRGEWESLRSQIVILESGRGKYPKYPPFCIYRTRSRHAFLRFKKRNSHPCKYSDNKSVYKNAWAVTNS